MKGLKVICGLFLVLLMAPMAIAVGEVNVGRCVRGCKLMIIDVNATVDDRIDKNLENGDIIREEAKPGSKVKFSIEVFNNFTNEEDVDIEDTVVTVAIEGIDDDDDLEGESDEFDLNPEEDDQVDVEFEIPLEVEEDEFDVVITVEGDTDANGSHESELHLILEVEKEANEVRFLDNLLNTSETKCGSTVQLSTRVINTGADDEQDVALDVTNAELGISFKEVFDLSDDPFEDDSKFNKIFTFTVPYGVPLGSYNITSEVKYNNGKNSTSKTANLAITSCIQPLKLSDLDVKVDGKSDKSLQDKKDGYKISKEAKPGSNVEFIITLENLYTDEEKIDIENIEIIGTIKDIDEGDDLEEESNEFDLDPEDDKKVTLEFEIPLDVEEDSYDVVIEAEGKDSKGITHKIEKKLELEVKKENHDVQIKTNLNPDKISCQRRFILGTELINLGSNEEEAVLEILNDDLGINANQKGIELDEGIDDNRFSKSWEFTLNDNLNSGVYPIYINLHYDEGKLSDRQTVELTVQDCKKNDDVKKDVKKEKAKEEDISYSSLKDKELEQQINEALQSEISKIKKGVKAEPQEDRNIFQKISDWFLGLFL